MKKIVVFTGAGVSADSGLATFRDSDGLWANYRIEDVCTPEALRDNRAQVVDFYNMRRREMLGGFNENATRDLVLRFLALGVFTPLMRNHAALGTRNQECYSFENSDDFKDIVEVRYRLIPYLYRTFKKASEENDMIFRPLSFDYPDDKIARECETQLMLGDECMICPVYEQNVGGRYVYLPENMTFVKLSGTSVTTEKMSKGTHYIEVALNEVPLFIKDGRQIELCKPAMRTSQLDTTDTVMIP